MLSLFKEYLLKKNYISSQHKVLCAVSGGIDSMVLLDLFLESKFEVGVVHINHHTRDGESDHDEEFVQDYCRNNSIPFYSLTLDKKIKEQSNFQENARKARYRFFYKIAEKHGYDLIATAHHADDDVETFFINLLRGTGLKGLTGIPEINSKVIRPIKFASKIDIEKYQRDNDIQYVFDSSNASIDYVRNRIRLNIIPELLKVDEKALDGIQNTMANIKSTDNLLRRLIEEKYKNYNDEVSFYVNKSSLPRDHEEILTVFYYLYKNYGFTIQQFIDLIESTRTGAFIETTRYRIVNEDLVYSFLLKDIQNEDVAISQFGEYTLKNGRKLIVSPSEADEDFWFDQDPFPFQIRSPKAEDSFKPKGMNGESKTIKKYMKDAKMSNYEKSKALLVDKEGIILGLIGRRNSHEAQRDSSKNFGVKIQLGQS